MEPSKTQIGTGLTNATAASNSTNGGCSMTPITPPMVPMTPTEGDMTIRPSQSLGIAGDVRPPEGGDSVPTVEELQQLLTKQNWLLARITNEKEPLTTTEKQEIMETLSRLTQLVNAGQKELGTTTDSHQPTIREPIPSTTSNLSPSEVVKQMKTKQPTPMWSFGSSSIGVLRNLSPGELNSMRATPSTTTTATSSTATVSQASTTLNGRVMSGTNITGAAPTVASPTATPSTTSPTTTTTVFGSSTFGGSTQPLGFGSVRGTTEASEWTTTDQPFTISWITPPAASSSSSTTPCAPLTFGPLSERSNPFGDTISSVHTNSPSPGCMFPNAFGPTSSTSLGTRERWNWLQGPLRTTNLHLSAWTGFKTPNNWTPGFLSSESSADNAAAYNKWRFDEWHEPIVENVSPGSMVDENHPSATSSSPIAAAVSFAPKSTQGNFICECEFHRFILRLFHFYRNDRAPAPFIQTHLIQLLYQLADRTTQCYLTIMHEAHHHSMTPEWVMDQPMKSPIFHYAHQQVVTAEDVFIMQQHKGDWNRATHLTRNLVQRWIKRFQTIRPDHFSSASSTSDWLMEQSNHLRLAAFVQGVLECFVHQLSLMSRQTYSVVDLWTFLRYNPTFFGVWCGLRCQFKLSQNQPPTWIPLTMFQHNKPPPLDTYEAAFNIEHSWIQEHMNTMNASSWYMQPKKLSAYAEQFASARLQECPLSRHLRDLGVRPLQYWLVNFPTSKDDRTPKAFGYVSFLLTDSIGQEFRLLYGRDRSLPFHLVWNAETNDVLCGSEPEREVAEGTQIVIKLDQRSDLFDEIILKRTPLEDEYYKHLVEQEKIQQQFRERFNQAKEVADQQSPLKPLTYFHHTRFQIVRSPNTPASHDLAWKIEKLEQIFAEFLHITRFSLFGPTLYEDNRPIKVKREFHSLFMDACLAADGLTPLPKVLNELISDYYMIPIPFIPAEAEEQMRQYPLSPEQPYKGHTLNPVETSHLIHELGPGRFFRHCQTTTDFILNRS